mgnify:CR=1 FL=1
MKVKLLIANTCSVLKSLTNIIYMRCEQLTLRQRSEVTDLAHLKLLYPAADNELSKNWKLVTHFLAKIHEHMKHFFPGY